MTRVARGGGWRGPLPVPGPWRPVVVPLRVALPAGGDLPDLAGKVNSGRLGTDQREHKPALPVLGTSRVSAISNAPRMRLPIVSASAIVFMPSANRAYPSGPKYDCCALPSGPPAPHRPPSLRPPAAPPRRPSPPPPPPLRPP